MNGIVQKKYSLNNDNYFLFSVFFSIWYREIILFFGEFGAIFQIITNKQRLIEKRESSKWSLDYFLLLSKTEK